MKTVVIVQSRLGSSRLPGKALLALNKRPVLDHVLERVLAANVRPVVLATSVSEKDDALLPIAERRGISTWRGSEQNVLMRVVEAARWSEADAIMRVTADCPFFAPEVADLVFERFLDLKLPYVSNDTSNSGFPDGTDVEVFTRDALEAAYLGATKQEDCEHVTPWIRRNFQTATVELPPPSYAHVKLSLDTQVDYDLAIEIVARLKPRAFSLTETLAAYAEATKKETAS